MSDAHHIGRFFHTNKKAFLINVSDNRDRELYESLSGAIVSQIGNAITLKLPYASSPATTVDASRKQIFKITSTSMGNGVQAIAELTGIEAGNTYHLKLRGNIEMYQRSRAPRIETSIRLHQINSNGSLEIYLREHARVTEMLRTQGLPRNLFLEEKRVSLGIGGIRIESEARSSLFQLSLFFFDLNDGMAPVCALAEQLWSSVKQNMTTCGYRFIRINKKDMERIGAYIQALRLQQKLEPFKPKKHWELREGMMCDV